jgi:anti-anti-sigma factor
MALRVESRVENEIGILDLEGALTLGPTLRNVRETARQILAGGGLTGLVVTVDQVSATDSAGLGELTVVYTLATKANCRVALAGENSKLGTMLEVTRLDGLLPMARDITAAKKLVGR